VERDSRWILRELVGEAPPVVAGAGGASGCAGSDATDNALRDLTLQAELQRRFGALTASGAGPVAAALARLAAAEQGFVLHWIDVIAASDRELALAFAERAAPALRRLGRDGTVAWLDTATAAFDRRGLGAGLAALEALERFASEREARAAGLPFDEVAVVLRALLAGLGGRALILQTADEPYTDTACVFLPPLLARLPDRADNFRLYKAMAVHLWAQTVFGTWRAPVLARLRHFRDRAGALAVYAALERERLDARVEAALPGVARDMAWLRARLDAGRRLPPGWAQRTAALRAPKAGAEDSADGVEALMGAGHPPPCCYHGPLRADAVWAALRARVKRERGRLQVALGLLERELDADPEPGARRAPRPAPAPRFTLAPAGGGGRDDLQLGLRFDGQVITPPAPVAGLLVSLVQDLGEVPDAYLAGAADAPYEAGDDTDGGAGPPRYHALFDEAGVHRYREWDHDRQRYRPAYCALRESEVEPGDEQFIARTLDKYAGLARSIRRTFEALIGEVRPARAEPAGDEVDLDALVAAHADRCAGAEPSERVYTRLLRDTRNVAVMIMVDMSGSTRGWVNDAEREALVLLCEALQTLGDRYAIYGFSGRTHKRCEVYRIKRFEDAYDAGVRRRISGIRPRGYTRMGAPIRHLGSLLDAQPARTKLLVTLSDGKPEDYRSYRGAYGIEDTRRALLELRRGGIHPYCITIDREGGAYLPHMYGPAGYAVIDDVARLPCRIAEIYRRIST